jgi:voltage-gated potassium channel
MLIVGAAASAAVETDTVPSFGRGLWWSLSLMTTEGFVGGPPRTTFGAVLSVGLMLTGLLLVALVSASLASLFVEGDERPEFAGERRATEEMSRSLRDIRDRLERLEQRIAASATQT